MHFNAFCPCSRNSVMQISQRSGVMNAFTTASLRPSSLRPFFTPSSSSRETKVHYIQARPLHNFRLFSNDQTFSFFSGLPSPPSLSTGGHRELKSLRSFTHSATSAIISFKYVNSGGAKAARGIICIFSYFSDSSLSLSLAPHATVNGAKWAWTDGRTAEKMDTNAAS